MFSSRIFRQATSSEMRRVQFLEFGESEENDGGVGLMEPSFIEEQTTVPREESREVEPQVEEPEEAPVTDVDALVHEAYVRGRKEGLTQAREEFGQVSEAMNSALEQISNLRESLMLGSVHDMKRLVLAIAEQVVGKVAEQDSELILRTIKKALHYSVQADEYHIRVNPDDYAVVTEKKPLFLSAVSGLNNIVFESDPSISPGGCVVESELGEVDATIESQLEEIRKNLLSNSPTS